MGRRSRRSRRKEGIVSGPVIEVVKGGLILDIGLRGFLPASLVDLRRVRDLQPFVGRTLECKIIELDKNRNNVVLSRRAYLEETQREQRDEFLANLKPGEVRQGVVSSVVNFGAFVDLGGMDGLVHVSELSWKHVDHPSSVVQVGDEVTVQVLDVDLYRERISLSLKATQQDPWQEFATGHQVGELVYGRVTKLVPFGAFVQVGDGIEGLVHISEMAVHHVEAPEQVVTPGEELWVKIIDIDLDRRRISLSIKQAAEGGEVAAEYRQFFGEHAYDEQGNYIGPDYRGDRRRREAPKVPSSPQAHRRCDRGEGAAETAPDATGEPAPGCGSRSGSRSGTGAPDGRSPRERAVPPDERKHRSPQSTRGARSAKAGSACTLLARARVWSLRSHDQAFDSKRAMCALDRASAELAETAQRPRRPRRAYVARRLASFGGHPAAAAPRRPVRAMSQSVKAERERVDAESRLAAGSRSRAERRRSEHGPRPVPAESPCLPAPAA